MEGQGEEDLHLEGGDGAEVTEDSYGAFNYWRLPVQEIDIDLELLGWDGQAEGEEYNSGDDFGYDSDKENDLSEDDENEGDTADNDGDEGWITPGNVVNKKKEFNGEFGVDVDTKVHFLSLLPRHCTPGTGCLHDHGLRHAKRSQAVRAEHPRH